MEKRPDLVFYTYPTTALPDLSQTLILKVGAPVLTLADAPFPLLLIDGTWRLAQVMEKSLPPGLEARSLPSGFKTAYPRRQTECPDPETGLASIEALFLSHLLLQRPIEGLLDQYHWKEKFLCINESLISQIAKTR